MWSVLWSGKLTLPWTPQLLIYQTCCAGHRWANKTYTPTIRPLLNSDVSFIMLWIVIFYVAYSCAIALLWKFHTKWNFYNDHKVWVRHQLHKWTFLSSSPTFPTFPHVASADGEIFTDVKRCDNLPQFPLIAHSKNAGLF